MASGPNLRSNEELWSMHVRVERKELDEDEFLAFQRFACPGCGACQYMGTAATMQVMSEALRISPYRGARSSPPRWRSCGGWRGRRASAWSRC